MFITYDRHTNKIIRIDTEMVYLDNSSYITEKLADDIDDNIIMNFNNYKYVAHKFVQCNEFITENKKQELRYIRKNVLKAFDIYKINVIYGIVQDSILEKQNVLVWYKSVLDLNEDAILNPPDNIKQYINNES